MHRIYLDHAATTPLCEAARAAMSEAAERFGNPSSLHEEGRRAKDLIDEARETVAKSLGCLFAEVLFASGGTEAANLAIVGAALAHQGGPRDRILIGAAEHHCVLHAKPLLERLGYSVGLIPVDREAVLDLPALDALLSEDVLLVSAMHANNEFGSLQPAREIASLARRCGVLFHCDAVQTFLTAPFTVDSLGADLLSVSAHKVNGPKGVGALYMRAGVKLDPLSFGGAQEREVRAGTENVPAIAGFGAAVRWRQAQAFGAKPRNAFVQGLGDTWTPSVTASETLPGHAHGRFPGIDAETLLIRLDMAGIAASSGAACSSGSLEPSHVMLAAGYSAEQAKEAVRFSLGVQTTEQEAAEAAERVASCVAQIRTSKANG